MVIKTASPGILVNEVDLTRGTSDAIITNLGALAGPFKRGPVDQIVRVETEAEAFRESSVIPQTKTLSTGGPSVTSLSMVVSVTS